MKAFILIIIMAVTCQAKANIISLDEIQSSNLDYEDYEEYEDDLNLDITHKWDESESDKDEGEADELETDDYEADQLETDDYEADELETGDDEADDIFKQFDTDNDGRLSMDEVKRLGNKQFEKIGGVLADGYEAIKTVDESSENFFKKIDKNKDGYISHDEYYTKTDDEHQNDEPEISEDEREDMFKQYDIDNNGQLSKDELKELFHDSINLMEGKFSAILNETAMTKLETDFINGMDENKDESVSREEFYKGMGEHAEKLELGEDQDVDVPDELKLDEEQESEMVEQFDTDTDGQSSKIADEDEDEYNDSQELQSRTEANAELKLEEKQELYKKYDTDGNGQWSTDEARAVINEQFNDLGIPLFASLGGSLGVGLVEGVVEELIKGMDKNKDDVISFEEFFSEEDSQDQENETIHDEL